MNTLDKVEIQIRLISGRKIWRALLGINGLDNQC